MCVLHRVYQYIYYDVHTSQLVDCYDFINYVSLYTYL